MAHRLQMHCTFLLGNTPSEQKKTKKKTEKTFCICFYHLPDEQLIFISLQIKKSSKSYHWTNTLQLQQNKINTIRNYLSRLFERKSKQTTPLVEQFNNSEARFLLKVKNNEVGKNLLVVVQTDSLVLFCLPLEVICCVH